MRAKNKQIAFACQISEDVLKIGKYISGRASARKFIDLYAEELSAGISDKELSGKISAALSKLSWRQNPVTLSLPRSKVTLRHIKVPTDSPQEIEKIVSLQAPRYLPYPAEELITAYQVISTDKQGYSLVNLIIAHKDIIERYLKILANLKVNDVNVAVSSFGLLNLFNQLQLRQDQTVMLLDVDHQYSELVMVREKKLLFSRYFKLDIHNPEWIGILAGEIHKTQEAYLKEAQADKADKLIILSKAAKEQDAGFIEAVRKNTGLIVESINYPSDKSFRQMEAKISASEYSFAGILGFGLKDIESSLNLIPLDIKEKEIVSSKRKEQMLSGIFFLVAIGLFFLGLNRHLQNKERYLQNLKAELQNISTQTAYLETASKRLKAVELRAAKKLSSLDLLYELHQIVPATAVLSKVAYELPGQAILRGQTTELDSVFTFAGNLEKSPVFKSFNIKVKYAAKKQTSSGEVVDFEIVCEAK